MPTTVKARKVSMMLLTQLGLRDEGTGCAVEELVGGPDAAPLALGCHRLHEEAVRRLLLADVDRADHAVAVPRSPLGQCVDEALPRRRLPRLCHLLHGV